jgi:uncharacterized membrane protein YphA (DoxX/SURF4 family)
MKTIRIVARLIIAPVFIFSGFVKAIDPLGSTYKFTDYFTAFGFDFLNPLAFALAIILSTAELTIGLCLLMGNLMRITSWALLVFMSFFTILTFISALTNPVTDCGCFGDALILTNWQTFWKNIALMVPTIIVFINRNKFKPLTNIIAEWSYLISFIFIGVCVSIYNYRNLPALDFRHYKIGTNIPSSIIIPEGAEKDSIEYVFIYERNSIKQEFTLDSLPDSTWSFVDRKDKIIKKGYVPPIHDFSLTTLDGNDITDSVLSDPNFSLLVIAHDLNKSSDAGLKSTDAFAKKMIERGVKVYGMTGSTRNDIDKYVNKYKFCFDFYTCDETALKTVIRANPGILLIENGTIIAEWHFRNLPEIENSVNPLSVAITNLYQHKSGYVIGFYLMLLSLLIMSVLFVVRSKK